jgi:DNA-binding MarR family transcriptional regulator
MKQGKSRRDHIDALQSDWESQGADLDRDALGVVLRIQSLARLLAEQAERTLDAFDLNWWQYDVLSALRRQGPPYELGAGELAQAGALSTGALTTRIDRLLEAGLVERERDEADRRRVVVRLTRRGRRLVDRAAEARFETAEAALAGLDPAERSELNRLLRRLLAGNLPDAD